MFRFFVCLGLCWLVFGCTSTRDSERAILAVAAAHSGDASVLKALIHLDHDLVKEEIGMTDRTLLMSAARAGNADIAGLLIGLGADVNHTDAYKHTALFDAASKGHVPTLRILCTEGAPSHKTLAQAFCIAVKKGNVKVVEYLLSVDASVVEGGGLCNPIKVAESEGNHEILEILKRVLGRIKAGQ